MKEVILSLLSLQGVGRGTARKILETIKKHQYWSANLKDIINFAVDKKVRISTVEKSILENASNKAKHIIEKCENEGIQILTTENEFFPKRLLQIIDYPIILFAKGNLQCLGIDKNVAIIGARNPSEIGIKSSENVSSWFVKKGYVITSGLAKGCDTAAHWGCINSGGKTIAIVANGLDTVYPSSNKKLADSIIFQGGVLLSEYAPGESMPKGNFIERDRLQSAISKGVIVIESSINGGSMHAVKAAINQGRRVGCIRYYNEKLAVQDGNIKLIESGSAIALTFCEEYEAFEQLLNIENIQDENENKSFLNKQECIQLSFFDER